MEKEQKSGKRVLFQFVFKRLHGYWGDPLFSNGDHEPYRTKHYLRTGMSVWPMAMLMWRQRQLVQQVQAQRAASIQRAASLSQQPDAAAAQPVAEAMEGHVGGDGDARASTSAVAEEPLMTEGGPGQDDNGGKPKLAKSW